MRTTAHHDTDEQRQPWETPTVRPVGRLGDVLKGGGGKVTVVTGDPGEPQKVPAQDGGTGGNSN